MTKKIILLILISIATFNITTGCVRVFDDLESDLPEQGELDSSPTENNQEEPPRDDRETPPEEENPPQDDEDSTDNPTDQLPPDDQDSPPTNEIPTYNEEITDQPEDGTSPPGPSADDTNLPDNSSNSPPNNPENQDDEEQTNISSIGTEMADYIIANWTDPDSISSKGWEYTNGIVFYGMAKIYEKTGRQDYINYIKTWADKYISNNGNIRYTEADYTLDIVQPSTVLFPLYNSTQEQKYKKAAANTRDKYDTFPTNAEGGFWHAARFPNEMWLDGQYMAIPFLTLYGAGFAEGADQNYCFSTAVFQLKLIAAHTLDSSKNLLYHAWDEDRNAFWADRQTGVSPEIWSRAMGWYSMALVDTLEYLPQNYLGYEDLKNILQTIAQGLEEYQDQETGLWYQVVDKGERSDNWLETSGSAMFIYSLKKAVDLGLIDPSYARVAEKGWEGVKSRINRSSGGEITVNGSVQAMGVQSSYEGYISKRRVANLPHGMAAVMMAASVMEF